ncbi:MAG: anti-sigma factor family protein [Jatrophihabitantaceae bacterium]
MKDDPYRYDDAAYVLGALSAEEAAAFEDHLHGCTECTARVGEVRGVPALLAGIGEADLAETHDPAHDTVPDTLLPALLRAARARRRRQRFVIGGLASVAAASVIAMIIALWPSAAPSGPARQDFVAVAQSPVRASASLTAQAWGTAIDVHCRYVPGVEQGFTYDLVAYDRAGAAHPLGDWTLPPDRDIDYTAGTSLAPHQITRLEITLPDGTPLLRMTT